MNELWAERYKVAKRRFIVIGGSYPGAMSAWFRYKYPHIAMGSLASSAVVQAIADYKAYDDHVYTATMWSGKDCTDRIMQVTKYIISEVEAGRKADIIKKFKYDNTDIDIGDFYYMLADISAGAV